LDSGRPGSDWRDSRRGPGLPYPVAAASGRPCRFPTTEPEAPASWPGSPRACCRPSDRSGLPCRYIRIRIWDSGARSLPDQVAPFVLGAIEGLIGERHEVIRTVNAVVGERCESDADRHVE